MMLSFIDIKIPFALYKVLNNTKMYLKHNWIKTLDNWEKELYFHHSVFGQTNVKCVES